MVFFGAHPDDETFGLGGTLARYALAGVKVYYVCATRGEAGAVDAHHMAGHDSVAGLRTSELECAARSLGLVGVIYLGYRDSGMPGSPDNAHPDALMAAPVARVAEKMVEVIRRLRPDVVITHDSGGGYGHPDHIAVHNAAVMAFYAAADPAAYPQTGPAFKPARLYFIIHPHRYMKLALRLMPLLGQDPRRFGRNKDIDLTRMMAADYPVHAVIRISKRAAQMRNEAFACHASQGGGRPGAAAFRIFALLENLGEPRDYFMRAYPPPDKKSEKDLFEGLR